MFLDKNKRIISLDPELLKASFVTIAFKDQKNVEKLEKRPQCCTGDKFFYPVLCFRRIILRIMKFVSD